MNKFIYFRST